MIGLTPPSPISTDQFMGIAHISRGLRPINRRYTLTSSLEEEMYVTQAVRRYLIYTMCLVNSIPSQKPNILDCERTYRLHHLYWAPDKVHFTLYVLVARIQVISSADVGSPVLLLF